MSDHAESGEMKAADTKKKWPLWKKLAIVGVVLLIVIPLAVGLGVGLTRNSGGSDDSDNNDNNGNGNNTDNNPDGATPRPSMWKPEAGTTWQIVLLKPITADSEGNFTPDNVEAYDVDLFDNDAETFKELHDAGKKVICYFSAGSYEEWRDDQGEFSQEDLGKGLDGWPGERWVRLNGTSVRNVMKKRIALAAKKGCDAIDPDNVDGFVSECISLTRPPDLANADPPAQQNDNGLGLTAQDSVDFMEFLSGEAERYNMSTGLKNAGRIIPQVIDSVHFSVNEQCVEYSECETFAPFIEANKPVFHIEYPDGAPNVASSKSSEICSGRGKAAGTQNFSTVIKKMNLDGWVEYCDGETFTTEVTS